MILKKIYSLFLKDNEQQRTIAVKREVILSLIIKIFSVIVGILFVPLMIDFLDKERYGIWLTMSSIFAWFSFFDIGLGNGMRNKLAEALAKKDYSYAKELVSTTYALIAIIFISLNLFYLILNPLINWRSILNVHFISAHELLFLTSVIFTLFLLRFIFQLIGVIYIATHKPSINNALTTLGNLLAFVLIAILYKTTDIRSLLMMGVIMTGMPLLILVIANFAAFNGKYKFIRPEVSYIKFNLSRELLSLGSKFFFIQIAAVLLFSTANIIITQLFNPTEVTVYNAALMYYQVPIMIYGIVMTPIWSAVTDAFTKKDFIWLQKTLQKLKQLSFFFVIGIIAMTIASPFVYKIWLRDRIQIPLILSISMASYASINVLLTPYTNFINGIGKMKLSTYLVFFTILFYIPLAIIIAKLFNNSSGIIIATCIVNLMGLYFQPKQVRKILSETAQGIWNK